MDWTGGYVGLQFATGLDATFSSGGVDSDADADLYGVFGGYRMDFGNFVLGAEIDYLVGDGDVGAPANFDFDVDSILSIGIEGGYDLGNTLVYAAAGLAEIELTDNVGNNVESSGFYYGIGADFRVTDQVMIGAELIQSEFDDFDLPVELESLILSFGVAYTF